VHVSPFDFTYGRKRFVGGPPLDFEKALTAYLEGLQRGLNAHPQIDVRLIVDMLWISSEEECRGMTEALARVLRHSVAQDPRTGAPLIVAIGMGGPEDLSFAEMKKRWVGEWRKLGLRVDIHSGEMTSAKDHAAALAAIEPDRIGHGIAPGNTGAPGPAVFFAHGISVCPSSNLLTGAFIGPLMRHPVIAMQAAPVPFCVNTDDPLLFGTTLTLEFVALRRALGWGLAEVALLTEAAIKLAFCPNVAGKALAESRG
jgi:adenosine deaminase